MATIFSRPECVEQELITIVYGLDCFVLFIVLLLSVANNINVNCMSRTHELQMENCLGCHTFAVMTPVFLIFYSTEAFVRHHLPGCIMMPQYDSCWYTLVQRHGLLPNIWRARQISLHGILETRSSGTIWLSLRGLQKRHRGDDMTQYAVSCHLVSCRKSTWFASIMFAEIKKDLVLNFQ